MPRQEKGTQRLGAKLLPSDLNINSRDPYQLQSKAHSKLC